MEALLGLAALATIVGAAVVSKNADKQAQRSKEAEEKATERERAAKKALRRAREDAEALERSLAEKAAALELEREREFEANEERRERENVENERLRDERAAAGERRRNEERAEEQRLQLEEAREAQRQERAAEEARKRFIQRRQEREIAQAYQEIEFRPTDMVIAVIGVTGSGKSTFIYHLSDEDVLVGHDIISCTTKITAYLSRDSERRIWLVDTPGFDDTNLNGAKSDSEILRDIALWLAAIYKQKICLAGILYLHPINHVRLTGSQKKNLHLFRKLCGADSFGSIILTTTHWTNKAGVQVITDDEAQPRINRLISEPDFWGYMVQRGSVVEKHSGTAEDAIRIVNLILENPASGYLKIQKELIDDQLSLEDTDAGQTLNAQIIAERNMLQAKLEALEKELETALRQHDQAWQAQISADKAELEERIKIKDQDQERLKLNLEQLVAEYERRETARQDELIAERTRYIHERDMLIERNRRRDEQIDEDRRQYRQSVDALNTKLTESQSLHAAERRQWSEEHEQNKCQIDDLSRKIEANEKVLKRSRFDIRRYTKGKYTAST